jgi:hypothetical protein
MSAFVWALIAGPIGGLALEAIGIMGTARKVATAGSATLGLVTLIERVKGKLDASEQKEAEAAIQEARQVQE